MRFRYLHKDLRWGSRLYQTVLLSGMLVGLLLWKSPMVHLGHGAALPSAPEQLAWWGGALALALLAVPAIAWLAAQYPLYEKPLAKHLLFHAGGAAFLTFLYLSFFSVANWLFCEKCAVEFSGFSAFPGMFISKNGLLGLVIYALLLVSDALATLYDKNRERDRQTDRLQKALQRAELRSLNAEINPHFIFNALQMIASLVHNDAKRAEHAIMQLSSLLRITLRQTDVQLISLAHELGVLKLYLDILQIRFGDALQIQLDIAPNALDAEIPNLLLQPLVENAIEHGGTPETGERHIAIACSIHRNRLQLSVSDCGKGFSATWQNAGVGLSNTIKRLEQLYGTNHVFRISDAKSGGANVTIQIPHRIFQNTAADTLSKE